MEENKKMGFFTKLKTSITKLEEYDNFLGQKLSSSIGYFVLLILILTAIFSAVYTYEYSKQLNKGISYIKNEMPDFTYENGNLKIANNVEAYDEEYNFRLIVNTDDNVSEETVNEYKKQMTGGTSGVIALKDKFTLIQGSIFTEYEYSKITENLGDTNITNKDSLISLIDSVGVTSIIIMIYFEILILYFLNNLLELFIYVLIVAIFGHIACIFAKVRFPAKSIIILAIYSVTLPNILYETYIILNLLTGFYIKYFSIFYMLISCVYIFTAIFMIKSDVIRQQQEIQAITEIQKKVQEEAEELEKEKEKEKTDEKKDESETDDTPVIDENNEPDGSEI